MWFSKGGITLDYIDQLSFKDYEVIVKEAFKVQKRSMQMEEESGA
jgi:hypothetical protein